MSYTRAFGFRDLTGIVREGRFSVPTGLSGADANGYLIGTAVLADSANAGLLTRPAADAAPTALSGIVVYEHIQSQGVDPFLTTPLDPPFIYAPQGRFAQVVRGSGVKVWLKNTTTLPLYDGRSQAGLTMVTGSLGSIAVGDSLTPSGANGQWKKATTPGTEWMTVTSINATTGLVEARLTF